MDSLQALALVWFAGTQVGIFYGLLTEDKVTVLMILFVALWPFWIVPFTARWTLHKVFS